MPNKSPRSCRMATCLAVLAGLSGLGARASAQTAPAVVTNDAFTIELEAYNSTNPASSNFFVIGPDLTPNFGGTQSYAGEAYNDQVLTVSSSETLSGNTFTDTIQISVPNSFLPTGQAKNGLLPDSLEFSIGNYNTSTGAPGNTLDFNSALSGVTATGTANFTLNATAGTLNVPNSGQNLLFANANTSLSDLYSINTPDGSDIGAYNVNVFTLTITNAVPEPSTTGATLLGAAGLAGLLAVRRRARA